MAKRRNKDPGGQRQVHQTRSFEQIVADATLARLGGYIDGQINEAAQAILIRNQQAMSNLLTRLVATEEILCDKLGLTKEDLATQVAKVQDRFEGFVEAQDAVTQGDRVRLEIKTRTADQETFQGSSRLDVLEIGSGKTLGPDLEKAVVGMTTGETKEVKFGKDDSMIASITVNRVSRQPKEETKTESTETAPQETANAADAG